MIQALVAVNVVAAKKNKHGNVSHLKLNKPSLSTFMCCKWRELGNYFKKKDEMRSYQAVCFLKLASKRLNVQGWLSRVLKDNGTQRGFWCRLMSKTLPRMHCVLSEPELHVLVLETSEYTVHANTHTCLKQSFTSCLWPPPIQAKPRRDSRTQERIWMNILKQQTLLKQVWN